MNTTIAGEERILGLNSLRGLAAVMVVAYHTPWRLDIRPSDQVVLADLFYGLDSGVAIFFSLSAFLLTNKICEAMETTQKPIRIAKDFMASRIARIAPLYLLVTIFMFSFDDRTSTGWGAINFVLHMIFLQNYLYQSYIWQIFSVSWTVAIEIQFYFLLAGSAALAATIFAKSFRTNFVILYLGLLFLIANITTPILAILSDIVPAPALGGQDYMKIFSWSIGYFGWWFVPGVLMGYIFFQYKKRLLVKKYLIFDVLAVVVFASLVASIIQLTEGEWRSVGIHAGKVSILSALLAFFLATSRLGIIFDRVKALDWLGTRAFGLYLLHMPILKFLDEYFLTLNNQSIQILSLFGFGLAASAVLAHAAYVLIEVPGKRLVLRGLGRRQ